MLRANKTRVYYQIADGGIGTCMSSHSVETVGRFRVGKEGVGMDEN